MLNKDGKPDPKGCGHTFTAGLYFISFMVIVSFIFLNLFIAIILESFNASQTAEGLQVNVETVNSFNNIWLQFDPKGRGFISVNKVNRLISQLLDEEIKAIKNY